MLIKMKEKEILIRAALKRDAQRSAKVRDYGFNYKPEIFYAVMFLDVPSQSYGSRIENYLCSKINVEKVTGRCDRGDCVNIYGLYHEIKISYKSINDGSYNFLQIRPWQRTNYLMLGIDPDNNFEAAYYYLTHTQLLYENELIGNNCHGTKESNEYNKNISRKFSFRENSDTHRRWISTYALNDIDEALYKLENNKERIIINNAGYMLPNKTLSYSK
jgi:hypothetical protein